MFLGLGLGLTRRQQLAEMTSPADLFALSPYSGKGCFFDLNDATSVFLTPSFSTNAALGQTVGGVLDLSGNGCHLVQSDPTKRPVYIETTDSYGRVCRGLQFDGINDQLDTTIAVNMSGSPDITIACGHDIGTLGTAQRVYATLVGTGRTQMEYTAGSRIASLLQETSTRQTPSTVSANPHVTVVQGYGTTHDLRLDGALSSSGALPGSANPNLAFTLGAYPTGSNAFGGTIYNFAMLDYRVMNSHLTYLENWFGLRTPESAFL